MVTNAMKGVQAVADIEVQSVAPAQGRQNQAQWMITAKVPWSQYPEKFWIDAVQGEAQIVPGQHHCAVSIGNQKPNTTGDAPFHYRFYLNSIDYNGGAYPDVMTLQFTGGGSAPAPSGTASTGATPPAVSRDKSIVRQSSIKAVVDAKVAAYNNATRLVAEGHIMDEGMPIVDLISLHAYAMFTQMFTGISVWVDYLENIVTDLPSLEEPVADAPVQAPIFEENV